VAQSMAAGVGLFLVAASAVSMMAAAGAAELKWLRFRSEWGRFAVQLPESPEEIRNTRITLGGTVRWTEYLARRGATEFRVEHHDLPWLANFLLSSDALLKRAKNGLVEEEHGYELSGAVVSVQGYPAREVSFRVPAEQDLGGDALLVLVGSRLYVVVALGPQAERDASARERFFRSFEVWEP
jgi:hypothetical protein